VNDDSTNNSILILLNYSMFDNRILIIDQRNRGLSEALNIGVKYWNGEFISFIDSDDILMKKFCLNYIIMAIYFYYIKLNKYFLKYP